MANTKRVQLRRGTTAEHAVFTGAEGELTIDTTRDIAVVHDGVTPGGHELVGVAATGQSIVNKVSIGIGTTNATSQLTVVGSGDISGSLQVRQSQTINGNLTVDGQTTLVGLNTNNLITVGVGNTDVVVNGTARITDTLSVGNNTITLNGNTNTITAETGIFNRLTITDESIQTASFDRTVDSNVSVGSTIIALNSISSLLVGDLLNIPNKFSHVPIVGFGTTSVSTYYTTVSSVAISTTVSVGSTIIGISTDVGISTFTQNYINIPGIFTNVPVVGYTTVSIGQTYTVFGSASITTSVSIGSTIIAVSAATNVLIGDYINVIGSINRAEITGFTTVALPSYYSSANTTSISTSVSIGATIIPLNSTLGVNINDSYLNIPSIFNNVLITGVTTVSLPTYYSPTITTTTTSTVSAGSTIIPISPTTGISTSNSNVITISGVFNRVPIVGVNTNSVLISTASTSSSTISSGTEVVVEIEVNPSSPAVIIGAASTYNGTISAGTTAAISYLVTPISQAVTIGAASTYNGVISTGATVRYERLSYPSSPAIIIGAGNTYNSVISAGTTATFATASDVKSTVLISTASTISSSVSVGTSATIIRQEDVQSNLNVNNIKAVGITTLEQLILNGLNFPTVDGMKGQVLLTDGAGNLGFGTGGGSGGSEVILRVSSKTGSDDNDGKILPLRTIKKATQLASKVGKPVTIFVETGEYLEDNPILVWDDVSIIGDSLRNIVVRPLNASKDLFKVRNGCYITGMSFNDYVDNITGAPQHTYDYAIAFDDPYNNLIDRTGYACTSILSITNLTYDRVTGVTTITTSQPHELYRGNTVRLAGIAMTCGYDEVGISTFSYDNVTGVSTLTFFSGALLGESGPAIKKKGYKIGDEVYLHNLPFSCAAQHAGVTTTIFPDGTSQYGRVFTITGINTAAKTITFNSGISTIPHVYEGYAPVSISAFTYDHVTGIATATTSSPHGFAANDRISLAGLAFTCPGGSGITTTIFPDGTITNYTSDGYTFRVASVGSATTFTYYVGVSTIAHTYTSGGTVKKVPTIQEVWRYPEKLSSGRIDFGVIKSISANTFSIKGEPFVNGDFEHYYTQDGTARFSRPIINKSPYIQNCSILSSLGGNGILVDGDKVAEINQGVIPELGEIPVIGDQPVFGKSMVAATFTMISFGGIGWRTINDGYAQVVSCFQIFCRYGSLTQSGGYLSITNSATNFGDKALRSTGFSRKSFKFDRGRVVANGTQDGLQTLRVVGVGRSDQELYVLRFIDNSGVDRTANFKPLVQSREVASAGVNTTTNVITISAHPFTQGESVVYSGNENANPPQVIGGLVNDASYYVDYIDASNFRLYEDEGLQTLVDLTSNTFTGVNTFTRNNQEFFAYEIIESHNSYQRLTLAGIGSTANFVAGRQVLQGSATGYAVTYNQSTRNLIVSTESIGGVRVAFSTNGTITDHSPTPISIGVTAVVGINTLWTLNFKVDSTTSGNLISGINSLTENYQLYFHRPSIINSSSHTWEYSGSGTDYNALPENGGQAKMNSEQVSELGGRVYASGTNELGDFKIGDQITAYNRTGNIIFNNKVTIGELASIRLSLSGGVAVDEFSTDTGLGDNEPGGSRNSRVSTQLAVKSFLSNRLGSFIDKQVSTNAVPNAVVQLNAQGQINADLIPPQVVTYNITNVGGGRTVLVNQIPAVDIKQGDTIVEPDDSFVLVNDVLGQYLILDNETQNYTFSNGDPVTSSLTETVTGIVTAPPTGIGIGTVVQNYVGYGSTGLVKGVVLSMTITNGGGGYTNPGIYTAVTLNTLTGIGTDALATITIGAGNTATFISAYAGGRGYAVGDVVSVSDANVGGRTNGSQLQATITDVETRLYLRLTNNQKFTGSVNLPDYISDANAGTISTSLTDNYVVEINPTDIGTGGNIDFANDTIGVGTNHKFTSGDPIVYDAQGGSMIVASGNGILNLNTYYVKPVGISSVELYYDYSLVNKINFSGSGIGTHALRRQVVNVNADKLVVVGHGYTVGNPFRVFGAAPTGITTSEFYYIGAVTPNSFTLHETQADALLSVNGVSFNPVAIAATSSGITTFVNQNIRYSKVVNTSSSNLNNYSLLARDSIDASNIVSGIVPSSRLGTGAANDFTFLNGSSEYKKVAVSIGIGTTEPMSATSTSSVLAPGGVGVNTYFGNIQLTLNRVSSVGVGEYTSLGVAKFKKSTFAIGADGEVTIKPGTTGDINAAQLEGQSASYFLDSANHTGAVPVTRGGTGVNGAPGAGAILIGNGSAYNLTTSPTFTGIVNFTGGNVSTSSTTGQVIITGGLGVSGTVNVGGSLNAVSKSFVITHPTKPGYKLQYGSLEGPENGVYVRGRLNASDTIELPDYWTGLVDEESITVTLTPIGSTPVLHSVVSTSISKVKVASEGEINCYYVVYAERKDTKKLVVEFQEG